MKWDGMLARLVHLQRVRSATPCHHPRGSTCRARKLNRMHRRGCSVRRAHPTSEKRAWQECTVFETTYGAIHELFISVGLGGNPGK